MPANQTTSQTTTAAPPTRGPYDDVLLNRYRIMNARGTGGFGTVLTCWDTRLQRRVAIKRLPLAGTGASSTLSEALAEARTSSMLAHPNIVTVFDFEVEGPYAYLVMEYVDGLNLFELLQRVEGGVLTRDEAACLAQSVASALGYAHENGVLHMDIKPTNIMIDHAGTIKLCDFGMATLASAAGYGGARGGTVGYMPPEQIEGVIVDERTDVFSLAVVVWQSLFGVSPFAASTAEASLALIEKGPQSPAKLDPSLAGQAEHALLTALAANPAARTPSVEILAKELVYALGDPVAGAQSLRGLLSQTTSDADDDPDDWEGERLPLAVTFPWLPAVFVRLLAAIITGLTALPVASALFQAHPTAPLIVPAVCAVLTAAWPPVGALLVLGGACAAIITAATTAAPLLLGIVGAIVLVAWWALCGTTSHLATPALLLPACLASPIVGTGIAGYALTPACAFITGCASWGIGYLTPLILGAHFSLDGMVDALLMPLAAPSILIQVFGCGMAALLCSAITHSSPSTSRAIIGQALACLTVVASQLIAARMENGGIWSDPSWENTGIAVVLCMLVCLACILHGPRDTSLGE